MRLRLRYLLPAAFSLWLLTASAYQQQTLAQAPPTVSIIYTSEMQGVLDPCG